MRRRVLSRFLQRTSPSCHRDTPLMKVSAVLAPSVAHPAARRQRTERTSRWFLVVTFVCCAAAILFDEDAGVRCLPMEGFGEDVEALVDLLQKHGKVKERKVRMGQPRAAARRVTDSFDMPRALWFRRMPASG